MKCKRVSPHCRSTPSGKGKKSCTRNGKGGTKVKGFYSPKKSCNAVTRIQAVARGRILRSKSKESRDAKIAEMRRNSAIKTLQRAFRKSLTKKREEAPFLDEPRRRSKRLKKYADLL